jgi:hypothetical protein
MFKLFAILYIFTNAYDTMILQKDAPIRNMKEFIENQQYREDQLRYHCKLNNLEIKSKKNLYETIYADMKIFITDNIKENIYPILYNPPIHCETYNDFIHNSQENKNINRELEFNNMIFIIQDSNPISWKLEIDGLQLVINDINLIY